MFQESRLLNACREGSYEGVRLLLQVLEGRRRRSIVDLNETDSMGHAPLETAITMGHTRIVKLLIKRGADLSYSRRYDGSTPLHCALVHERYDIVKLLLSRSDSSGIYAPINQASDNGFTPLHIACSNGNAQVVYLMLQKGACIESREARGWTPLFLATWRGHVHVVAHLISSGANVNATDMYGQTPIALACQRGHMVVALKLLEHGARATSPDDDSECGAHSSILVEIITTLALKSMATTAKEKR